MNVKTDERRSGPVSSKHSLRVRTQCSVPTLPGACRGETGPDAGVVQMDLLSHAWADAERTEPGNKEGVVHHDR